MSKTYKEFKQELLESKFTRGMTGVITAVTGAPLGIGVGGLVGHAIAGPPGALGGMIAGGVMTGRQMYKVGHREALRDDISNAKTKEEKEKLIKLHDRLYPSKEWYNP